MKKDFHNTKETSGSTSDHSQKVYESAVLNNAIAAAVQETECPDALSEGYAMIPKPLIMAILCSNFSRRMLLVIWAVILFTYAEKDHSKSRNGKKWKAKEKSRITLKELSKLSGINDGDVSATVRELCAKKVLIKFQDSQRSEIGVNPDISSWQPLDSPKLDAIKNLVSSRYYQELDRMSASDRNAAARQAERVGVNYPNSDPEIANLGGGAENRVGVNYPNSDPEIANFENDASRRVGVNHPNSKKPLLIVLESNKDTIFNYQTSYRLDTLSNLPETGKFDEKADCVDLPVAGNIDQESEASDVDDGKTAWQWQCQHLDAAKRLQAEGVKWKNFPMAEKIAAVFHCYNKACEDNGEESRKSAFRNDGRLSAPATNCKTHIAAGATLIEFKMLFTYARLAAKDMTQSEDQRRWWGMRQNLPTLLRIRKFDEYLLEAREYFESKGEMQS